MLLEIVFLVAVVGITAAAAAGMRRRGPAPGRHDRPAGTFVASIDGTRWTADATVRVTYRAGIVALAGVDEAGRLISLGANGRAAGVRQEIGSSGLANALLVLGGESWVANSSQGRGDFTLTAVTASRIAGRFTFTAVAASPGASPAVRRVCDGWFDIPLERTHIAP